MDDSAVTFYFHFNSPYAFLAHQRIERVLGEWSVPVCYAPFSRSLVVPDRDAPKVRYIVEDVTRFATAYRLPIRPGPYVDNRPALRGFVYAAERGLPRAYSERVFSARWLEARDISNVDTLTEAAATCGLDPREFTRALDDPAYEERLGEEVRAAEAVGVFGVPFLRYRGRSYWGNDRVEWLVEAVRSDAA